MAASESGERGPNCPAIIPTGSVSTQTAPSGMPMSATSTVCASAKEGEVLQTIELDRGCFACILGGQDGRTLFMVAQEWGGPENMQRGECTGQVLTAHAPAPGAGWP